MKTIKTANWKLHLDEMIKSETSMEYKPFPKQYLNINIDKPIVIKQISTKIPSIHVIAKITEDFEAEVNAQDEEALPPRVFCWNDVSTLSLKVAFKTISAGLESEYRKIVPNVTFDIKSFSSTSRSTFPDNPPDYLVYHIINPSLSESPVAFKSSKIKYSFSNSELSNHKMKKSSIRNLVSFPESIDATSLRQLGESISGPSIFIFDCPNAVRLLENIISPNGASNMTTNITKEIFAFGATSGILPCSSQLPYDLFTSCLLTPAKVAILMQTKTYADLNCGVLSPIDIQELINTLNNSSIADKMTDSLEKALEQFADRIAFESLENNNIPLFELVFRRDPFIANLFYHYLFACRVMKCISTTPFCYPYLPDMTNHPLWDTFDLEVDRCLFSLRKNVEMFSIDSLLERQMRSLEDWMAYPIENREMPDELSYLAMLLDSPKYFERAIHFTAQFLSISAATTEKFLNTRAFPVLIHKIPHLYSYILTFCDEKANPEPKKVDKNENDTQNSEDDKNDNKNENNDNNNNNNDNDNSNNNNDNNNDNIKIGRSKSEGDEVASTTKGDDSTAVLSSSSYIIPKEKEEAFADFSFSIASSILLSPDLRPCFNNYLPFWEKLLNLSTSERLIVSCLSCLIQFDMNRNDANLDLIKSLSKHKSSQVRTLAHFLLKKMKVPLDLPMCKVSDEEDPFCRLALVSRISESINEDNKHDLIFDLVLSLGDLFSFVREEAIITLAQAIEIASKDEEYLEKIDLDMNVDAETSNQSFENSEMNSQSFKFFESLKTFFKNFREDEIQNPIVLSLAREISFLTYDPSNRVRKRFSELLYFLESILFMEPTRRRSQAAIQASQNSNNASNNNNDNSSNINNNNNNDKSNKINDNNNNNDKSNNINDNNNDKSNNTSTNNNDNTSNNNNNNSNNISTTNNGSANGNENADSGNKSAAAAVDDHSANIRLSETARNSKTSSEPKKGGVPSIRPRSNLFAHCLSAIVHYTPEASDDCYGVSHNDLTGSLAGTPAVSPSGLIACPSTDGGIICQTHSGLTSYFDFFNQPVQVPPRFSGLVGPRAITPLQQNSNALRRRKCTPTYVEFIDDEKLLAVSDASQVIVIDIKNRINNNNNNINKGSLYNTIDQTLNASQGVFGSKYRLNNSSFYSDFLYSGDYMKSEPACSFWMEHPDNCFSVRADYNSQNFHLLEHQVKPESCKIAIFDLASQRRIQEFLISRNPPTLYTTDQSIMMSTDRIIPATSPQENWCIGWLQSFSPLLFTCTNKLIIYDERVGNPVRKADLNLEDDYVMGCNSAIAMPLNLVIAKRKGSLAMVDFRTMSIVDEVNKNASIPPGKRIAMFKVHREIPFGFGTLIDNSAFTTMFDSGSLSINFKETSLPIHSFALHATEAACVARSGSCAKFLDVRLD